MGMEFSSDLSEQNFYDMRHLVGERAGNVHRLLGARMREGQLLGVQTLPRDTRPMLRFKFGVCAAVDRISQQGVTE